MFERRAAMAAPNKPRTLPLEIMDMILSHPVPPALAEARSYYRPLLICPTPGSCNWSLSKKVLTNPNEVRHPLLDYMLVSKTTKAVVERLQGKYNTGGGKVPVDWCRCMKVEVFARDAASSWAQNSFY
jgi:hypothetical protein